MEMAGSPPPYSQLSRTQALFLIETKGVQLPSLSDSWSDEFKKFLCCCLDLSSNKRSSASQLLEVIYLFCEYNLAASLLEEIVLFL
jgi:hypothetical protein